MEKIALLKSHIRLFFKQLFFPELRKGDRIKIITAPDPKGNDIHAGKYGTVCDVPSYGGFEAKLECGSYLIVPRAALKVVEIEVLRKHSNTHRFSWKNYMK